MRLKIFTLILAALCASGAADAHESKRVVTLGGDVTEIVYALGVENRLVCDDQTSLYPLAATKLPQVGYLRTLAAEGIISCKPDVVLASDDAGPPATMKELETAGIHVVQVANGHSADAVAGKITTVAHALDADEKGTTLSAKYQSALASARAKIASYGDHPRALFLMTQGAGGAMVAGRGTAADTMLTLAGATNVADFEGYKPLTPEAAVALAPQVIIVGERSVKLLGGLDALRARPEIAMTPAGKSGHIVGMDELLLLGFGLRTPQALVALGAALHEGGPAPALH